MTEAILRDVRLAFRSLLKARTFSVVAIATLGLGLGANTAVFGVLNAVVLTPLPYPDSDRLVRFYQVDSEGGNGYFPLPAVLEHRDRARTFEFAPVYTYRTEGADLTDRSAPERVLTLSIAAGYFEALRSTPALGRSFQRTDERPAARLVVVSDRIWREYLGASPDAIGRMLSLGSTPHQVVGVMPLDFEDPIEPRTELWLPLDTRTAKGWQNHYLGGIGRLRPGASLQQAQAEISAIAAGQREGMRPDTTRRARVVPLQDDLVGRSGTMLWILLGAVGLLLLIACVNVASLFLARGAARQGELAVQTALGCSRARLVRQLLVESVIVAAAGGVAGLLLAQVVGRALVAAAPIALSGSGTPMDFRVFAFGFAAALAAGLAFGAAPAFEFTRPAIETVLREGARGGAGSVRQTRARRALVVCQVALALVLLVGAGLLMRTMYTLHHTDLGFEPDGVMTFDVPLPEGRYADPQARARLYTALIAKLEMLPGVTAAGATSRLPATGVYHLWGTYRTDLPADQRPRFSPDQRVVEGHYFGAMGIRLRQGRLFGPEDRADAPLRVVVSQRVVDVLFPEGNAIGRSIRSGGSTGEIIGVVDDVALSPRGNRGGAVYRSHTQFASDRNWPLTIVVSGQVASRGFLEVARRELASLDPLLVLHQPRTLGEVIGRGVAQERFALQLIGAFAGVALLLAAVGVYGVLSYSVSRRRREIGIRIALGATSRVVRGHVIAEGARLAAAGVICGVAGALAATRWLDALVFGVSVRDPLVFSMASVLIVTVAIAATAVPAIVATRVSPLEALRGD